jgi:hypothetical protein
MRIESDPLTEKLVRVDKTEINRLVQQMSKNIELNQMLASPMESIPQYYYLYSSESAYLGSHSLLDIIRYMAEYEHQPNLYFSKIGSGFTGFLVYKDDGKVIKHIKMASFKDDRKQANPVLAKDIIEFVLDMAGQRKTIEWLVDPNNTKAMRQYDLLLSRKKLNWEKSKDGKMIKYSVHGYKI